MRYPRWLSTLSLVILFDPVRSSATSKHEAGRCAIRGSCGKQGFFGSELPCPDNGLAAAPSPDLRTKLVTLCGPQWSDKDVCCDQDQVESLATNLARAQGIIETCPACKENFFNLFCEFTCSPDQSLFVNVTETGKSSAGKDVVVELDNLWSREYQSGFFDSCKDVKFGAANGKAMTFIGGGAKNYTQFLKFLGDKKLLGSPFQMNFVQELGQGMEPLSDTPKQCNDTSPDFRCNCVDCPSVCPILPKVQDVQQCHVGRVPCLTFAVLIIYSVALVFFALAVSGHIAYLKHKQNKSDRLQLLQDGSQNDEEEDDNDYIYNISQGTGLVQKPQRVYQLNQILDGAFAKLGRLCARYPGITIGTNIVIIGLLSLGWLSFNVELDPVRLWVAPNSDAAQEKAFFDDNFGPFYRTEQAFLVNDSSPHATVLSTENLEWWFALEQDVAALKSADQTVSLQDICFRPTGDACVVQSVSGYFEASTVDDWRDTITHCADQPGAQECLPPFMDPLLPGRILGGYDTVADVLKAKALIMTWVVNNHQPGTKEIVMAEKWEVALKARLLKAQTEAAARGLKLSFSTERSLEEELNQSANTDANIVVISYIVMFVYASLALGSTTLSLRTILRNPSTALVQSKFTLGMLGIVIVLMSVSGSVGLFSALGVKVTLIIAEVIPFLVLAVGVDNIFLIVHEFERVNSSHPDLEIDDRMARALGRMGPSILLSASTETVAFAMGAFVGMPAVKNFAAYAAGAVAINAALQVTMFVSVLALNQRRVEALRVDCIPCLTVKRANTITLPAGSDQFFAADHEGMLQRFIRKTYAPVLLNKKVKVVVLTVFITALAAALCLIPYITLGLDQQIALPSSSYLIPYFRDLFTYFASGPPVYFVLRNANMTQRVHQQQTCGQFTACDPYSLANILELESQRPEVSYISSATASWIDNYLYWLKPSSECCLKPNGETCLTEKEWSLQMTDLPTGREFVQYAEQWIAAPTTEECPNGGSAGYSAAVVISPNTTDVPASHWRTFHTALQSQNDLINSYAAARRIAADISSRHGIDVFPYSKHYVFFDQYRSIIHLTGTLLAVAVAIIFILSSLLLGSLLTGLVVSFTTILILVDILGVMAVAGVSLNALSLVNLVICVGISVEFCAHISRAFMFPKRSLVERVSSKMSDRDARSWAALINVGGSVFSGITITKFLGVAVLAFTRSKVFEVYYFRIWLALVILASSHALVLLPVLLSMFGGEGYTDPDGEGGLEEDLGHRRGHSLLRDDDLSDDE